MRAKYKLVRKLTDSGFPTHSKFYKTAHTEAEKLEKAKFPSGYAKMKKIDEKVSKHELVGKNLKDGKIFVSKKVPKKFRAEVAFHEKTESKNIKRLEKEKRRK